jgi:hypothetical protein
MTDRGYRTFGTCEGSESINGTVYAKTISVCNGGRYSEWEGWSLVTGGDCSELAGTVGFVDSSKTTAEAVLTVYGDGTPIHTSTYTYGMARRIHVNIEDYLKVKVSFTSDQGFDEWQENVAIGDGRVRCTG